MFTQLVSVVLVAVFPLTWLRGVRAADVGTDNAQSAVYADGWKNGTNGVGSGKAFGDWRLVTNPEGSTDAGFELDDSKLLDTPGADVNTGGKLFALHGKRVNGKDAEASAYRDFNGGGLSVNQKFSIDLAVNYRNGYKGIDIRGGSEAKNDRKTLLNFNIGNDDYVVNNAATGNGSVGNEYKSNTKFHIEITQTTITGGTFKIIRAGGNTVAGTYTGVMTGFKLYCSGTDGNKDDKLCFNNLAVSK